MARLEIERLKYRYPGTDALTLGEISCTIDKGEFVALIGASGSGKTSFCYAITGVIPHLFQGAMTGRVVLDGEDHSLRTVGDIARDIGLVLQAPMGQISGVRATVFEEVAFGLENRGVARKEILKRVEAVLTLIGLEAAATRSPLHLSGGEQQRLALATVLAVDPAIIVLDEPTTFLDPAGARLVFDILHRLQQQGKTVVIAEQRLDLVAEYADRVLAFDSGRIVMDAGAREVLASPLMKAIRLNWTRYTQTADLARQQGLWPKDLPLPTSLPQTIPGFVRHG